MKQLRRVAWILILVVDLGYIAWGGIAAAAPERLAGPHGTPILTAGYEGFTRASWSELSRTAPQTAAYIELVFRMYGLYCAIFGLITSAIAATAFRRGDAWAWWTLLAGNVVALPAAMTYDWTVNAIGAFELTEYLGLAMILVALAVTAPFSRQGGARLACLPAG